MHITVQTDYSLHHLNTFGMKVRARRFAAVASTEELRALLAQEPPPYFLLGGGSNLLLTRDLEQLVIQNAIRGREVIKEEGDFAWVAGGGGENWHEFVCWCLDNDLGGVENLSLIPGTLGAAPIQNIGAYGVELRDVFDHLEAVELATGQIRRFDANDMAFRYRDSIFKNSARGRYAITRVVLRLTRRNHRINISYGAIREVLAQRGLPGPTIRDVSEAVIHIRRSKLPDPQELGNAGSFFKNPEISPETFDRLQQAFPHIVHYALDDGRVKLPAGWLIEQCGWKGKRKGDAGCYEKQALVLVNYGSATGAEIAGLA